ncbi:MAG: sigma 54-interacting transcriptional regulator [Peptostreptococcaceae bacterium]|nr:sigma 54-interacting transcriptional regulator [Peptostreptococcaceae bacterium]
MTADFYKKALDCSSDGILITDEQGNVIYVNEQYEEVTGLQASDLLGQNLAKLLEEGIISRAISLEVIETGQRVSTIHSYITGKSALSTANPIYDNENKLRGVVNNTRNLNTLIALREELKQSQEQTKHFSAEVVHLRQVLSKTKSFIYRSKQMQRIIDLSQRVALYDSTVLIEGESGTGKEVMARLIHYSSPRREEPFIKVNCAAIPSELFESELFGYEKGAFTGASATGKIGMFELANKGTLLMDEIGELPLYMQSKLLRVLQEKEIYRVGGKTPVKLDVRILASTNRNLAKEVEAGNFREDLFFRLNVVPITVAPLRERTEDIPLLINHFLEKINRKYKTTKTISDEAMAALTQYSWPGNVRELENIVEYLYVISEQKITMESIPGKVLSKIMLDSPAYSEKQSNKLEHLVNLYEKTVIEDTILRYNTLETAANALGIHFSTLSRKMKKYDLHFEKE